MENNTERLKEKLTLNNVVNSLMEEAQNSIQVKNNSENVLMAFQNRGDHGLDNAIKRIADDPDKKPVKESVPSFIEIIVIATNILKENRNQTLENLMQLNEMIK